ncbi:MAG TPA: KH domain-containing protein [Candidatus Paceibacterota bacterium]|nr:KH domain-containing protein [Candidatus Paceibacterota bacterium]
MENIINMQDMRHLNLFGKITRVNTRFCFNYNQTLIFCVPRNLLSKAIGKGGQNIRQINEILRKRIKVISTPEKIQDAENFIKSIIKPVTFKDFKIKDNEIILTAGIQNKAALIGRDKRRFLEMKNIVKNYFGKEFKIM